MRQKLLLCICVALVLSALPGTAAPACSTIVANYASLIALGSGGCQINDLVFSNFTFTPSATGTGLVPVASQMAFSLDNPGSSGTGPIWGFEFNPNLSIFGIGSEDILIQYDITAPVPEIASVHLLETALVSTGATATVAEGPDCAKTTSVGACTFLPIISVTPSAPHQDLLGIGPDLSVHVVKDINVVSTTANGFATISNVRDAVDEITVVPEPASSFYFFGAGLVLIVVGTRKRIAK
jgi:hypothetical protein